MSGVPITSRRRRLSARVAADSELAREEAEFLLDVVEVGLDALALASDSTRLGNANLVSVGISVTDHLAHAYIQFARREWTAIGIQISEAALGEVALGFDTISFVNDLKRLATGLVSIAKTLIVKPGHERPARALRYAVKWLLYLLGTRELRHVLSRQECFINDIVCDLNKTLNVLDVPSSDSDTPRCFWLLRMRFKFVHSLARSR